MDLFKEAGLVPGASPAATSTAATRPVAARPTAPDPAVEASKSLCSSKHYWVYSAQTGPGETQFDIHLYINGTWVHPFKSSDPVDMNEIPKYLDPGVNKVSLACMKTPMTAGKSSPDARYEVFRAPKSNPDAQYEIFRAPISDLDAQSEVLIGEGAVADGNLNFSKVLIRCEANGRRASITSSKRKTWWRNRCSRGHRR